MDPIAVVPGVAPPVNPEAHEAKAAAPAKPVRRRRKKRMKYKKINKTAVNMKLRYAKIGELKDMLRKIFDKTISVGSHLDDIQDIFVEFEPDKAPPSDKSDNPFLQECFICHSKEDLTAWENVGICSKDLHSLQAAHIRRNHALQVFNLRTKDIEKYDVSEESHKNPIYDTKKVINCAKRKHGSIYDMVKKREEKREWERLKATAGMSGSELAMWEERNGY